MRGVHIFGLIVFLVLLAVGYYFFGFNPPAQNRRAGLRVSGERFEVEIAESTTTRMRGLSGRASMGEKEGMLFIFDEPGNYGFWMRGMRFPIDIVWIVGDEVAGVSRAVEPEPEKAVFNLPIYYPPRSVDKALELNAGAAERHGIQAGDRIVIE